MATSGAIGFVPVFAVEQERLKAQVLSEAKARLVDVFQGCLATNFMD
jgi:hypothetical protein